MPAANSAIAANQLPATVDVLPARQAETDTGDGFLALLNAGAPPSPLPATGKNSDTISQPKKENTKDERNEDPQAAVVNTQQQIMQQKTAPKSKGDKSESDNDVQSREGNGEVTPQTQQHPEAKPDRQKDAADDSVSASDAAGKGGSVDETKGSGDQDGEDAAPLRSQLQAQFAHILQILQAMMNALQNASGQPDATQQLSLNPQDSAGTSVVDGKPAAPLALLQNIQSVMQQMQAALSQDGAAQSDFNQVLHDLTQTLQQQIALLSQMEQQPGGGLPQWVADALKQMQSTPDAKADAGTSAPVPDMPLTDMYEALREDIALVRGELQKLKGNADKFFAEKKAAMPVSFNDIAQVFKDVLSANGYVLKEIAEQPVGAGEKAAGQAASQQQAQLAAPPSMPAPAAPVAAAVTPSAQLGADGNGAGNNGGQPQGQSLNAPAPLSASSQSQQAQNASGASFSKALHQASSPAPLLDQVKFHIKSGLADGNSKIHIQLNPEELGKLDIKLTVHADGKTGVSITADNRNTLDMLQRDMQGLTRALADAGLTADSGSLSFNLRGDHQQGQGDRPHAAVSYMKSQPEDEVDMEMDVLTRSYVVNLAEGLDIKI